MYKLMIIVAVAMLGSSTTAATIEEVSGSQIGCTLKVSGLLEDGDAERVASHVGEGWQYDGRICFDSPGGSFMEGLALARAIRRTPTGVDDGDRCESACFLAFMAGTLHRMEDRTPVADRVMHPGAHVGYHAPSLRLPGGRYGAREVSEAYDLALLTIADLIQLRNERYISRAVYGELYEFRDELIEDMMRTPPDTMRYVETVGDAAFLNIQIHPVELPENLTYRHAAQACRALGRISQDFDMTEEYNTPTLTITEGSASFSAFFNRGESASRCTITYYLSGSAAPALNTDWTIGRAFVEDWWIDPNDFEVAAYMHYPFDMPIVALRAPTGYSYANYARDLRGMVPPPAGEDRSHTGFNGGHTVPLSVCFPTSSDFVVTNVEEYVNIRQSPGFGGTVVEEAPLGSGLTLLASRNVSGVGTSQQIRRCQRVCERLQDAPGNQSAQAGVRQCLDDNVLWYRVRTEAGNEGYVSGRFLGELAE